MGLRFRKSYKVGPLRINLSKSGIGWSVGNRYFRYTKKAGGGARTTATIPKTGISVSKEIPSKNQKSEKQHDPTIQPRSTVSGKTYISDEELKTLSNPLKIALAVLAAALIFVIGGAVLLNKNAREDIVSTDVIPVNAVWYPDSNIQFTEYPGSVMPGEQVSLKINGNPSTIYAILVYANDGPILD